MNQAKILEELGKIKEQIDHLMAQITLTVVKVEKHRSQAHKNNGDSLCTIKAKIKAETNKALLLENGSEQGWVAKSQIKNDYNPKICTMIQEFIFPSWIRNKNFSNIGEV